MGSKDIRVCFGNTKSAIKYASVLLDIRLKNYNLSATEPEKGQTETVNPTEPPAVDEQLENLFSERLQSLEEFLYASGVGSSIGTNAARFLLDITTRNGYDYSLEQTTERFRSYTQIIAPITEIGNLNESYQKSLFEKIEASGLYDLVAHIDAIRAFGRERLQTLDRVKGSAAAAGVLDGVRDTAWLQQLVVVLQRLSRDPVTLATIYRYRVPTLESSRRTCFRITRGGAARLP
jgi:hypothetical protein